MLAKAFSFGINGLDAYPVTIEVDISRGLPSTVIVGLPDNAVKESKERVRTAIKNSGYKFKPQRVTINLSPADVKKEGPWFDLSMALGFLAATEQIDAAALKDYIILGELSLDGAVKNIRGALSIALSVPSSRFKGIILPAANAPEAAVTGHIPIYPVKTLKEVIYFLHQPDAIEPLKVNIPDLMAKANAYLEDFADVKGQVLVKRGLEVACAGGHNCLLIGPPGSGKSMLSKRIPTILPDMTLEESLETTKIHSIMGLIPPQTALVATRPFRSPHHTSSDVALIGGGSIPKPGEVTLSHNGVLFLDELPEFNRNVLESLRQPLEDRNVTVSRALKSINFPAQFMLVCSMNPCPCGWFTDPKKECHCSPHQIQRYLTKISGPLLDRIDIHLEVSSVPATQLLSPGHNESSREIKKRTSRARNIQQERFAGTKIFSNAQMDTKQIRHFCPLGSESKDLLNKAIDELGFSARAHDRIIKVARTIADLDENKGIEIEHIAEAIQYRSLDRNWWG